MSTTTAAPLLLEAAIRKACPSVECVREYAFHPTRKWRLDLAWPAAMTAVEIHGSVWTQGRHTRGGGFVRDREKMNAAGRLGWSVYEVSTDVLEKDWGRVVDEIVDLIRTRLPARA
jgi:very-short-patch-repair endonuclease